MPTCDDGPAQSSSGRKDSCNCLWQLPLVKYLSLQEKDEKEREKEDQVLQRLIFLSLFCYSIPITEASNLLSTKIRQMSPTYRLNNQVPT